MPIKIIIYDTDIALVSRLRGPLEDEGYSVVFVNSHAILFEHIYDSDVRVILLDLNHPLEDMLTLHERIKTRTNIPVFFLTQEEGFDERIKALEAGADDYITKPFSPRELLARIRNLLRRMALAPEVPIEGPVQFGAFSLNPDENLIHHHDGRALKLSERECLVMQVFLKNTGEAVSRDRLHRATYEGAWSSQDRSVDVLVGRLRRKLNDFDESFGHIDTIRFVGYRFRLSH